MTTKKSFNLSSIMSRSWMLIKMYGLTMSEALKKSWGIAKTIKKMHEGIAHFSFVKAGGIVRDAWGSLVNVPETIGKRVTPSHLVTYFDREKNDWRSFKMVNFIGLN